MAYDGLVMAAITRELQPLIGARVEKVFQPEKTTLLLQFRLSSPGMKHLVLAADPRFPRVHLTENRPENPPSPPMFCMLLRKHLTGARLTKVTQWGLERVLTFDFESKDELGDRATFRLVAEVMGRHSNVILVGPGGAIVDSLVRVPPAMSSVRILLPGVIYETPGHQDRTDTLTVKDGAHLKDLLDSPLPLARLMVSKLTGLSPQVARELVARAGLPEKATVDELETAEWDRLGSEICALQTLVATGSYTPTLLDDDYGAISFPHKAAQPWAGSMNQLVDYVSAQKLSVTSLEAYKRELQQVLTRLHKKEERKLSKQEQEKAKMEENLSLLSVGQLILANLDTIPAKATKAEVTNYYDPELRSITIDLDPSLSAVANAKGHFRRYEKARQGLPLVDKHIKETRQALTYLASLEDSLQRAENKALVTEIREEMEQAGLVRQKQKRTRREKPELAPLLIFYSLSGREIWVGRSNWQNERLLRQAQAHDWWLHAKNIPGAHVLIKGNEQPDDETLEMAAQLAAYYSQAREGSKVPVDYTKRRHVKKLGGAPAGFVTYTDEKTLLVEPNPHQKQKKEKD